MKKSFDTLQTTLDARRATGPVAPKLTSPLGINEAILENLRRRNAFLDWIFYDLKVITDDEAQLISPWLAAEGAIMKVPPSDGKPLEVCNSIDELIASGGGQIRTIVVAGVGSSALGTAALARNVADALDAPVAAVVSGYGLADVAAEAFGGFFWFGAANLVRHTFEPLDRLRESGAVQDPSASLPSGTFALPRWFSKDTRTVEALLLHPKLSFDLLVGHSKGNLVLSEALFGMRVTNRERLKALARKIHIVTLSAKIAMPAEFGPDRVIDVLGTIDGLGTFNSRWSIGTDMPVYGASHHTNTDLLWHLPVTQCVGELRGSGRI